MVFQNKQLMPGFPPEGIGPTGVPMNQALPTNRKQKTKQNTQQYPAYLGQAPGAT